jgi:protein-tyrosine-phosphatase
VTDGPPEFVRLAAHPVRWRLLGELVRSDRAVRELTELVGEPQSLVSYHLRQLRDAKIVRAHRSSADGRDTYYAVDLSQCEAQLRASATALHPALWPTTTPEPHARRHRARRPRVLFLCTGNSGRSQMAEALAVDLSHGAVDASSAGSHPKPLHDDAVRVMRERGIDISDRRSKHFDELPDRRFDAVITLCDRVREVCPDFPAHPRVAHWSIPDPAQERTARASLAAFERTADELETRIRFLLPTITVPSPSRRSSRAHR